MQAPVYTQPFTLKKKCHLSSEVIWRCENRCLIKMDRRVEIYNSALKFFVKRGYDHTPMSHIANALGLSKAGLYYYFTNKEHLLFLIHKDYLEKHFIPIIEKVERISDPENRIALFIR